MSTSKKAVKVQIRNRSASQKARPPSYRTVWKSWQTRSMSILSRIADDGEESEEVVQAKLALYAEFLAQIAEAVRFALASAGGAGGTWLIRELAGLMSLAILVVGAWSGEIENLLDNAYVDSAHVASATLADFCHRLRPDLRKLERVPVAARRR